jgi:hypothetical protein
LLMVLAPPYRPAEQGAPALALGVMGALAMAGRSSCRSGCRGSGQL